MFGGRRERLRRSAFVPYQTGKALSEQVSGTLDKVLLFSGYDKQIRPGVSGIFEYTGSVNETYRKRR